MGYQVDKYISTPLTNEVIESLQVGDYVYITGLIYAARDAAHKRIFEAILEGKRSFGFK